jgi:DNA-binding NtrC family response regulator
LAVVTVRVPPLRERREDIPLLVEHFAGDRHAAELEPLVRAAMAAAWPGNLRDLKNFVFRSLVLGPELGAGDDPVAHADPLRIDVTEPYKAVRDRVVDHVERVYVEQLMAEHRGNVSAAARAAGMNRTWLHELIKRHGITGR